MSYEALCECWRQNDYYVLLHELLPQQVIIWHTISVINHYMEHDPF